MRFLVSEAGLLEQEDVGFVDTRMRGALDEAVNGSPKTLLRPRHAGVVNPFAPMSSLSPQGSEQARRDRLRLRNATGTPLGRSYAEGGSYGFCVGSTLANNLPGKSLL